MTAEVCAKLCNNHSRNTCQMGLLLWVYVPFKPADQSIIDLAMNELGPTSGGRAPEEQLRLQSLAEFFKHNMNLNHIGPPGIDAG